LGKKKPPSKECQVVGLVGGMLRLGL